ncbi:DciA family protein [Streptomyces sioyaensis]|uniref:DciA family protein n=1 Tax=Streptomyces sioyaensis TaxID=67364 RepID=UPI0037A305AD
MTESQTSGPDLARQALASWKATAKKTAATGSTKPRKKRRAQYGDGRDPVGLGSVLGKLGEENEWRIGVQGGSLTDQWATLCPELVGHVEPAGLDPVTGRLDLRPGHHTAATQLRILGPQLVTRLQQKGVPVRTIRVLRVAPLATAAPATPDTPAPQPEAPIKTRADASPGYRAALDAAQAGKTDRPSTEIQQRIKAAAEAQTNALRARREPIDEHRDAVWFVNDLEETAAADCEKTRQAAIRRARDQKAGLAPEVHTAFQRTA